MRVKTALSVIIILFLSACSQPERPSFEDVARANKELMMSMPEYVKYTIKGIDVKCNKSVCYMSESDFRQSEHDKDTLLALYKAAHKKDIQRVIAYNNVIEAQTHNEVALSRKDEAIDNLKDELWKERATSWIQKWVERIVFIGGIAIFSQL